MSGLFFADVEVGRTDNTGCGKLSASCREMPIICADAFTPEIKDDKIIASYYMEAVDEVSITVEEPLKHSCQALLVGCFEDDDSDPLFMLMDQGYGRVSRHPFHERELSGKTNKTRLIHTWRIPRNGS